MKKRKYNIEIIKNLFNERGFVLKEKKYISYSQKMLAYCTSCNNEFNISLAKFIQGRGCKWCANASRNDSNKLKYLDVKNYFDTQGCKLLSTPEKINAKDKLSYKCVCGNIWATSWNNFKKGKRCGCQRLREEKHPCWNPDREQVILNHKILAKSCKALSRTLQATNKKKNKKVSSSLGYGTKELLEHLQKHPNWKSLKNKNWHLDHIFPVKAFVENGITNIKLINCLDNLQPLSPKENLSKGDSYDLHKFQEWLKKHEFKY